jgi:hypothetical protein
MARDEDLVEVIVRPRRSLWHGGAVHLPGDVIALPADDADVFASRLVVRYASPSAIEDVRAAIARGGLDLYAEATEADFAALDPDDRDRSDPQAVRRKRPTRRSPRRP